MTTCLVCGVPILKEPSGIARRRWCADCRKEYSAILAAQGWGCAVCGNAEKLVLDHDHETGLVRGILCNSCNMALGYAHDNARTLRGLADYLQWSRSVNGLRVSRKYGKRIGTRKAQREIGRKAQFNDGKAGNAGR